VRENYGSAVVLRGENAQLRELVVQLTKLVMKNIVENKQPVG
jgi:hypothetical protein